MSYANDMPTVEMVARTDAGLASELRLSVMRLRRRLRSERHPDNALSIGQLAVLGALFRNGDRTVGELAAHERVQPPCMTRTVNCLDEGGYVVRRKHETDGRQVVVALTEKGTATLAADRAAATPGWPSGCASSPPTSAPCCGRQPRSSKGWLTLEPHVPRPAQPQLPAVRAGAVVSNTGTWMQRVAQDWLVLQLTAAAAPRSASPPACSSCRSCCSRRTPA